MGLRFEDYHYKAIEMMEAKGTMNVDNNFLHINENCFSNSNENGIIGTLDSWSQLSSNPQDSSFVICILV